MTPHLHVDAVSAAIVVRDSFLLSFPALFSIVNPLGASLIFAQATDGRERHESLALARTVAGYSFVLLVVSVWIGSAVLAFFGVTINALRVAGGLVVAIRAFGLLQSPETTEARREKHALQDGRTVNEPHWSETAFFPLTMPFTVGPGSISVAIALRAAGPTSAPIAQGIGITGAAAAIAAIIWVAYSYADRLTSLLGLTGTRIVSRLAALILLCIGVQILAGGISGFASDFLNTLK